jgi:hypothetical protein
MWLKAKEIQPPPMPCTTLPLPSQFGHSEPSLRIPDPPHTSHRSSPVPGVPAKASSPGLSLLPGDDEEGVDADEVAMATPEGCKQPVGSGGLQEVQARHAWRARRISRRHEAGNLSKN